MGETPPRHTQGTPGSPRGRILVPETRRSPFTLQIWWKSGEGDGDGERLKDAGKIKGLWVLEGLRSSLAQPQPPRSCWPAITSHYSLPGSGTGLNAAGFSWLLASTEEETLLSDDKHQGESRNSGPGACGAAWDPGAAENRDAPTHRALGSAA